MQVTTVKGDDAERRGEERRGEERGEEGERRGEIR